MSVARCCICGRTFPAYYLTRGHCDGCKWDTWIPAGYRRRENYRMDPIWGQFNATRRPALGVEFLDRKLVTVEAQLASCRHKPRLR